MSDESTRDAGQRSRCPDEAALMAMLHGPTLDHVSIESASDSTTTDIADHVDTCPDCQAALELLTQVPPDLVPSSATPHSSANHDATIHQLVDSFQRRSPFGAVPLNLEHARAIATNIDDFDTVELIGSGGSGVLFRARHKRLGRDVAIKVWPATSLDDSTTRSRVDREAQALARLDHPDVVRVFDYGTTEEGAAYLVMEYVNGRTLNALIRQIGALSPRRAATLVRDVANALESAHRSGLIHRDVKPSNILMPTSEENGATADSKQQDRVKLVDFGLVLDEASEQSLTLEGAFAGTPYYMSPEQIENAHAVDCRADVYSLGVVLYELLTATRPFHGVMRMVLHQALHEEPIEPRKRDDSIPVDLETICLKAMAKEPAQRYASAAAFGEDLQRWLDHKPIHARRPSFWEKAKSWARHNPQTAAMVVSMIALLLTLGIGGPIASFRISKARDAAEAMSQQMAAQRNQALATLHTMVFDIPDYLSKEEFSFEELEQSVLESALRGLEDIATWPQESDLRQDTSGAVAVAHARLAGAYYFSEENGKAREHANRAIAVAGQSENARNATRHPREAKSIAYWFLANIALEEGQGEQAVQFAKMAIQADRERLHFDASDPDSHHDLLATLEFLVDVLVQQGNAIEAAGYIDEAIVTSVRLRDEHDERCGAAHLAHNLTSKGLLQLENEQLEAARQSYQRALSYLDDSEMGSCIDLPLTIADCCHRLASIAEQEGDAESAVAWREKGRKRLDELRQLFEVQPDGIEDWFEEAKRSLEP